MYVMRLLQCLEYSQQSIMVAAISFSCHLPPPSTHPHTQQCLTNVVAFPHAHYETFTCLKTHLTEISALFMVVTEAV